MNIGTDYQVALEQARQVAEAARKKAEAAKAAVEKETAEAEQANAEVDKANDNVTTQNNEYVAANTKVTNAQAAYDNAVAWLNSLAGSEDEDAINRAQADVDRLKAELDKAQEEAQKEYDELVKAQQDADTALKKAEIETKEAEQSVADLEAAEAELEAAELALKEAEEAAAAEEAKLEKEVSQLTEEEAIEQGYTIIKTAEDLQAIANNLSGKYILMNDIDLAGIEWEPIGKHDPTAEDPWAGAFKGEFNGNGFSIKNLTVAADKDDTSVGLFGATDGATITNTIVENANVTAPSDYNEIAVGGLIGISRDTNIDNVTVTGNIAGHQGVGGLIGVVDDSHGLGTTTISNVNTDVNVNSEFYAGGLIGRVDSTQHHALMIENCHTSGNVTVADSCAGGLIGEAGKTIITVNNCSSDMNIARENDYPSELSGLLDTSRIGGIIGNCNGTFISVCNSEFTGTLKSDDEFQGEVYGWYMNDAQVSIFELSAGLPVDDILKIDGIDAITPKIDPQTGVAHYEITVSTLAGMNKIVDMIESNPKLADMVTFNIQFDFEAMDEAYENSEYSQYGVVQHLYEDEDGTIVNDVYIDNEIDLETTFNVTFAATKPCDECECKPGPKKTMIEGLYKDDEGKYYIFTGETGGKYDGFTEVSLEFFCANQRTIVRTRLDEDEVRMRDQLVSKTYEYQAEIQKALAEKYGYQLEDLYQFKIQEPEYKALKKKEAMGQTLTDEEKLKIELFELNYKVMNIVGEITKNEGCGMGGNASFLERTDGVPLEDEWGRTRYMTLDGIELRQKVDENGEPVLDDNGNPVFETLDGTIYDGSSGEPYIVRGFPVADENNNLLYTDSEGKTLTRTENEDGTYTFTYEDGTVYEGDPEELTQQLEEYSPADMYNDLNSQLTDLAESYGVEVGGEEAPAETSETEEAPTTEETPSETTPEEEDPNEKDPEEDEV